MQFRSTPSGEQPSAQSLGAVGAKLANESQWGDSEDLGRPTWEGFPQKSEISRWGRMQPCMLCARSPPNTVLLNTLWSCMYSSLWALLPKPNCPLSWKPLQSDLTGEERPVTAERGRGSRLHTWHFAGVLCRWWLPAFGWWVLS